MKRLLLFDIDGTLISGGPAKEAFHEALLATFQTAGAIEVHDFSGKTDPQIARELLQGAGLSDAEIDRGFPELFERYLAGLERRLPDRPVQLLPGVIELIEALAGDPEVALGLVTGNVVGGARLKLSTDGLVEYFAIGGYGSDSEERNELPGIALTRAEAAWGFRFDPSEVFVIGDTPRDVECGRFHGVRTLAVATGNYTPEELREAEPDHLVHDFGDPVSVQELLLAG